LDHARIVVYDCDSGLVVATRVVTEILLIDGREQERYAWKELLAIFAREDRGGAGDRYDQVRPGMINKGRSDVVDHRLFGRADKPCWSYHDLDDVDGLFRTLVQ